MHHNHAPAAGSSLCLSSIVPDGVEMSGGFFGLDQGVTTHGLGKTSSLQPRIDNIVLLATVKNAQASMRLLGVTANKGLDYLTRITPPLLLAPALAAFDQAIQNARHQILQLSDCSDPGLPTNVHMRSTLLAELPLRDGGFGQMSTSRLAPCAFIASVRATHSAG